MLAEQQPQVKAGSDFLAAWQKLNPTERRCCALAMLAIEEAAPILLEEGGVPAILAGLAVFMHGETLPSPIVAHLEEQAAKLKAS
jgi:hypothetical protein